MNIGENIKKFRKEKGFTQQQLADLMGKSTISIRKYESGEVALKLRTNLGRYETGDREPRIGTLELISEALGITVQELITGEKQQIGIIEKDITQFTTEELIKELYRRMIMEDK